MSWDVMLFKFAGTVPANANAIDAASMLPMGASSDVTESISKLLPTVDWSDPTWGNLDGDGFSIELSVGDEDPVTNIMLHVRGGGDAIASIMRIASQLGWSALDCSTGEFLNPQNPSAEGWEGFQAYRDKVIGDDDSGR